MRLQRHTNCLFILGTVQQMQSRVCVCDAPRARERECESVQENLRRCPTNNDADVVAGSAVRPKTNKCINNFKNYLNCASIERAIN